MNRKGLGFITQVLLEEGKNWKEAYVEISGCFIWSRIRIPFAQIPDPKADYSNLKEINANMESLSALPTIAITITS